MADWYYKSMGAEVGPLTNKEMLEKVRKGEVTPETEVRKNDSKWYLARAVGGLMEQAAKGTKQQVCPYCGHMIENPPAKCESCGRYVAVSMAREEKKEPKPSKHDDIADAMAAAGEDANYDEGPAKYALLTFAGFFVLFLGIIVFMVVGKHWTKPFLWTLAFSAVAMMSSLFVGLWLRRRETATS